MENTSNLCDAGQGSPAGIFTDQDSTGPNGIDTTCLDANPMTQPVGSKENKPAGHRPCVSCEGLGHTFDPNGDRARPDEPEPVDCADCGGTGRYDCSYTAIGARAKRAQL
jgi:hypothetical protein